MKKYNYNKHKTIKVSYINIVYRYKYLIYDIFNNIRYIDILKMNVKNIKKENKKEKTLGKNMKKKSDNKNTKTFRRKITKEEQEIINKASNEDKTSKKKLKRHLVVLFIIKHLHLLQ